ncbi:2-oxoacid:acceptor oxidoreductase family protein [Conexivisphaera calida]|uniref:2-oxoacid:acceptor oxidoreductase family protein n=1 Tax=Conexivisphaera calida TaxID=1874277 RepID=UPI00157AC9D9|nr:2-oxoacid:acceptor oxidoreductase family protein [Conexivisphaera calida]
MASRGRFRVLASGRGGLGVVELGSFVAYRAMLAGKRASVVPTYGPQTRGGKVDVMVVEAFDMVENPVPMEFDALIAVDSPALESLDRIVDGGLVLYNEPLVRPSRVDRLRAFSVDGTEIAEEVGSGKLREPRVLTSSALMGAFVEALGDGSGPGAEDAIRAALAGRSAEIVELNLEAARRGRAHLRGPIV